MDLCFEEEPTMLKQFCEKLRKHDYHLKLFYQVAGNLGKKVTVIQQLLQLYLHAAILLFIHSDQYYESLKSECARVAYFCSTVCHSPSLSPMGKRAIMPWILARHSLM